MTRTYTIPVYYKPAGDEWVIEWPDGVIQVVITAQGAFDEIQRWSRRVTRKSGKTTMTHIEWTGTPPGFTVPT